MIMIITSFKQTEKIAAVCELVPLYMDFYCSVLQSIVMHISYIVINTITTINRGTNFPRRLDLHMYERARIPVFASRCS